MSLKVFPINIYNVITVSKDKCKKLVLTCTKTALKILHIETNNNPIVSGDALLNVNENKNYLFIRFKNI